MKPFVKQLNQVLAAVLTIVALTVGQSAWAMSSFTVAIQSSSSSSCTFRISREGNTTVSETIDWRVVSLSAMAGMHFTGYNGNYSGQVTFNVNDTYVDIPISETTPSGTNSDCFQFQNTTSRSYRFEVLDKNGDILASKDRSITTGTQFTNAYVNQSVTDLVYFTDNGSITSGSGNKYLDVSYSSSNWIQVTDGGYKQGVHTVSTNSLYNNNTNLRSYLHNREYKMYATVYFTQKEEQDGYQYIQIYTGSAGTYDTGDDPNGGVNDPSNSLYKACFILSYSPSGSVMSDSHYQFFPHRYDDVDKATEISHNITHYEFDYNNSHLYQQKFKTASPSYKASNSGSLVLTTATENIHIRFDAGGSDGDTWDFKDLKVRLALVDNAAPTVINNYMVSGGRHQKGNTIYVSVPFKEIVTVTGTPTLSSNWGTLSYIAGSGSNVLTFSGTIDPTDNNPFSVSSYSLNGGTIKDLAGNSFNGSISHSFGTTLNPDYEWTISDFTERGTNTYEICSKADLYHLASLVNVTKNNCSGLTFLQTQDITCDASYAPIGYYVSNSNHSYFCGIYDGNNKRISGITVNRTGSTEADSYVGVFGYCSGATIRNVVLANSTFTGFNYVGGIVGYSNGSITNCCVENTVTINTGTDGAQYHGGITGWLRGNGIVGCVSAATVNSNGYGNCKSYGGITGFCESGTIKNCLYTGSTVDAYQSIGAIVGSYNGQPTFTNNYYTASSLGGVNNTDRDGARRGYTVTLGENVVLVGDETAYDVSGLTAIGTGNYALRSGSTIYSGKDQTLTFSYTGEAVTTMGYAVLFYKDGTPFDGNSYKMTESDVCITASATDLWGVTGTPAADGSADHPYRIGTRTALDLLASYVNSGVSEFDSKHFLQTGDITYDNLTNNNYTAIGYYNDENDHKAFKGHYNGGGRTITGIQIVKTGHGNSDSYLGLFGYVDGGTIENVVLTQSLIKGNRNIGSIAGYLQNGTIQNCHIGPNVSIAIGNVSNAAYQGGVVGQMSSGSCVQGCFCGAEISRTNITTDNWYYGGIAGYSLGTIQNNIFTGSFINSKLNSFGGAIAGYHSGGTLANNYYTSTTNDLGGINYIDQDGARRARIVTLGENIALVGDETVYNVSGLTAIGTGNYALSYNDGTTTTIYSGEGQNLTLSYTGDIPTGYALVYSTTVGTVNGNILVMPDEDVTVSANVSLITYTVRFNKNNDDASGTMSNQSFTYDEAQNLTANAFTRTGYDFAGWSTTADGSGTTYTDGQEVSNLTFDNGAVIDLFAQWTPITVTYIDENGDEQSITYPGFTLLESSTGRSVELGTSEPGAETWYVAKDNVSITYTGGTPLKLYEVNHLILMDGATLTVEGDNPIRVFGSLTIYGQSLGTGRLEATGSSTAIYVNIGNTEANNGTLTINGGNVNATSTGSNGISLTHGDITINGGNVTALGSGSISSGISLTRGDITINGGTVNATGGKQGNGIYGNSTITINGGNVSATGGYDAICASTITLGWRNASDRIYASSYYSKTGEVVIKSGQTLTDGTDLYSGTVDRTRLAGKTLQPAVSYVDADGNTQNTTAIPLTNTMTTLAAGTYVVNSNLSFDHGLIFTDNVDLILVDGCTMSIGTEDNRINGSNALDCVGGLTIYGQTAGTGTLNLWAGNKAALEASYITIRGGTINANSVSGNGIRGNNGINIFSGNVNATSTSNYCIWSNSRIAIHGGVVNAINNQSKGISNDNYDIILGWTKLTDRITASSYFARNGSIYITNALYCPESVNGSNIFYCPLYENYRKAVKGKTLSPAVILDELDPAIADVASTCAAANAISEGTGKVAVQLSGRTLYKDGAWNTLCLPFDLTLSGSVLDGDNVDVRTLSSSEFNNGTLTLNFTAQGAVTELVAGTPYIIKWSKDNESAPDLTNLVNPEFSNVTVKNITANVTTTDVDFIGTYNQIVWDTENQSILFLSGNNTLYFPQPSSDSNNNFTNYPSINAFSAYFQLKNGLTASEVHQTRINFEDNEVNGIILMNNEQLTMNNDWYTLDGVKLDKQPMKKGMYINNGRKVVIK